MTGPQSYGYVYQPQIVRDQKHNAIWIIVAWVIAVITVGYMLPWAIAASRGKSNQLAVGLINFLLGWTFIGWVVALVMACGAHGALAVASVPVHVPPQQAFTSWDQGQVAAAQVPQQLPPPGWYPAPDGSVQQAWWDGQAWAEGPRT